MVVEALSVPPVTPPQPASCPLPTSSAFTQINPVGSTTDPPSATPSLAVTPAATGTCYAVTGYLPASGTVIGQYGATSNVVGPVTTAQTLSVTCTVPSPNPNNETCTGVEWVFSSAPANTATAPGVPALATNLSHMGVAAGSRASIGQLALVVKPEKR